MVDAAEILKEQYGAIPFRRRVDGTIEVMLVTARRTGRWIIPKGWPARGLQPFELAAHEAMEEGGVLGQAKERPIGTYQHKKTLSDGSSVRCQVVVFALDLDVHMKSWPESVQRTTRWFSLTEAATAIRELELKALLLDFDELIKGSA